MMAMAQEKIELPKGRAPFSEAFKAFISQGWSPYDPNPPQTLASAPSAAAHRLEASQLFPGERLVIPAGAYKVRNNDCDYAFRPHSGFAQMTGLGTDREPDAVLVVEPDASARLYFHPRVPRTDPEFYASPRYGEMWVGQRESLDEMSALCGFPTGDITELPQALTSGHGRVPLRVVRDADPSVTALVDALRGEAQLDRDSELSTALSELRLVKDDWELAQLREACRLTALGFEDVVANMARAVEYGRGERWVEGIFGLHARHDGNAVGYDTIAAAGDHANTLHWVRNDGPLVPGELLLMDAGIELDSLFTADITRTMPVGGHFSEEQRQIYDAVRAAQQTGMDAARPGAQFADVHAAAIGVLTQAFADWGILPVSVDEALSPQGGQFRRWMVHGTSHHLGLDVHDCAQARAEHYRLGELRPGMVITVEPGIYFKSTDLMVPPQLRGIGVRIEDDIVITPNGYEILSSHLPRDSHEVESWMSTIAPR
ncbi:Xaa-Pro aminopeptidase [Propionibacterium cyclohexanicum]|uniref:Xaa-Pro aminopeptidase n=2 Tax=Propionibacterium cyclohexanicum TaxID=64702 RepID=A0A1H9PI56_9ACTN|nr:Xaa-Pro aminopeptidase [Propionibacterium cyclohexanicum]